jgi:hypothetical protein
MEIKDWAEERATCLRERHATWDVWFISKFPLLGYTWHGRPKGHPVSTLAADTPDELSAAIDAAESEREGGTCVEPSCGD